MLRNCLQFVPSSLRRSSQASSSVSAISHTLIYSWSPVLGLRMSCVRCMSFSICEHSLSCSTGWAIAGKLYVVWQLPVCRDVLQGIHYMVKQMPVFWGRLFFDFVVKQRPVFWAVFFEGQPFTFTQQSTCFQRWTEFSFKLLYPSNKVGGYTGIIRSMCASVCVSGLVSSVTKAVLWIHLKAWLCVCSFTIWFIFTLEKVMKMMVLTLWRKVLLGIRWGGGGGGGILLCIATIFVPCLAQ